MSPSGKASDFDSDKGWIAPPARRFESYHPCHLEYSLWVSFIQEKENTGGSSPVPLLTFLFLNSIATHFSEPL